MSLLMWTLFLKMTYLHNQVWRFWRKDKTNRKFLFCGKAFILLLAHWSRSQTKMSLTFDPCQKYALHLFSWLYPSYDFTKKSNDLNNKKAKSFNCIKLKMFWINDLIRCNSTTFFVSYNISFWIVLKYSDKTNKGSG